MGAGITSSRGDSKEIQRIFKSANEQLFFDFHHQCTQENMKPDEIYHLLSSVYEKFVEEEQEDKENTAIIHDTTGDINLAEKSVSADSFETAPTIAQEEDFVTPAKSQRRRAKPTENVDARRKSSWGIDFHKAKALEEKQKRLSNIQYSIILPSQRKNTPEPIKDVDAAAFDFVVDTDEADSAQKQLAAQQEAQRKHPYVCVLCCKAFDKQSLLYTHFQYSQLHARTLEKKHALLEDAVDEARKLSSLLDLAGDALKSTRGGDVDLSSMKTSSLTSRVVAKFVAKKHEALLADLRAYYLVNPPKDDVNVVFAGSKFFWRHQLTFGINMFHHRKHDCIEIVPKLFPVISKTASGEVSGVGLRRSFPTDAAVGAPVECARLYVDFSALRIAHASWKGLTSKKTVTPGLGGQFSVNEEGEEEDEMEEEREGEEHSQQPVEASGELAGVDSAAGEAKGPEANEEPGVASNAESGTESSTNVAVDIDAESEMDLARETAMASIVEYALEQLKVDEPSLEDFHSQSGSAPKLAFSDPSAVLSQLPEGLLPSTIDDRTAEKTFHAWEIKRKIHQVSTSCAALSKAVVRTEHLLQHKSVVQVKQKQAEEEAPMSPLRRIIHMVSPRKKPHSPSSSFRF